MPHSDGKSLPSAKSWTTWYETRLKTWAGVQRDGFEEALDAYVQRKGSPEFKAQYRAENRMLAYEVTGMVDEGLLLYLVGNPLLLRLTCL